MTVAHLNELRLQLQKRHWIVVSENYTYISSRSGAAHGGVASVLRMVADELEEEFGKTIADLFPIDRALKSGEPMRFYGKSISLDKYKPLIDAKCESYVSDMVARLGDTGELSRVVLCGGGARQRVAVCLRIRDCAARLC